MPLTSKALDKEYILNAISKKGYYFVNCDKFQQILTMSEFKSKVDQFNADLEGKTAQEIIEWVFETFGISEIALASSLGAEDQVLTDIMLSKNKKSRIFTLDTGRLHPETYSVMSKCIMKYNFKYEVMFPDTKSTEEAVTEYGPNFFYESIEKRKLCCNIRKVEPLKRKLKELTAWITGLRREQAITRFDLPVVEWDDANGLIKINPLSSWTEQDVWDYIKEKQVPYNALHDKGFPSIGCAPCTRAVNEGEDVRAGRWWWENPDQKECGLHIK